MKRWDDLAVSWDDRLQVVRRVMEARGTRISNDPWRFAAVEQCVNWLHAVNQHIGHRLAGVSIRYMPEIEDAVDAALRLEGFEVPS